MCFVQDDSSIHTAKHFRQWLAKHGIRPVEHPPFSPDLNPQKNLWFLLKVKLMELHPELETLDESRTRVKARLRAWLPGAWEQVTELTPAALSHSVKDRWEAVYQAKGYQTKY
ncbi:uncharacterized protein K452DRAFT_281479 [Aplosporella prunicola CBS 121167]|uniref:Tc1-like transposase DDE domain-containing protein n=1 Tax=Aplosporella prunicola CBS 121167 TaxID=1176127 RepID=A0A6A6AV56_9PEZI|nr:uncharacterized protein K452DRAFT_281479 [Aplosporella prunicola CBS 121167]KAF2135476.1 hypothetical protein K452DRAFT_281479 [Aplosporella prunicola CBS 121167]